MGFLCEVEAVWVHPGGSTCTHTRVSAKNFKSLRSTLERLRCPRASQAGMGSMTLGTPSSDYKEQLLITLWPSLRRPVWSKNCQLSDILDRWLDGCEL